MISVRSIPTPFFQANCYVFTPSQGGDALVVDPSAGVLEQIRDTLDRTGSAVGAVLLTHGHPDHVWDAAEVASWGGEDTVTWLPGPDVYRMDDPTSFVQPLPPELTEQWTRPAPLQEVPSGAVEYVDGIRLLMVPAPGHTEGSAIFLGEGPVTVSTDGGPATVIGAGSPFALSGDVIFAGSVGRTDLAGGDETQMRHTLRTLANVIDPDTLLLPGHGARTTMAAEKESNPYIRRAMKVG